MIYVICGFERQSVAQITVTMCVPHNVGFKLNDFLLSAIAGEGDHGNGRRKDAFKRLSRGTIQAR